MVRYSATSGRQARPPRQARRFHASRVTFRAPRLNARLVNLSATGAAIETSEPPRIGAELQCELENDQTLALIPGEVKWCRLGDTTNDDDGDVVPVYRAGIHFRNGTPRNLLRILRAAGLERPTGNS
jgi:hypothetical protein